MGLFDGCLLASDIDGTLVESGYINPRNIEKIEFFIKEGGCFSLSTGRSALAFSDVLEKIKNVTHAIVLNGSLIYDYTKSSTIYSKVLPYEDYRIPLTVINSGLNVGIEIHTDNAVYTLKRTLNTDLHQKYERFGSVDIDFEKASKYNWNKVLYIFDSAEDREKVIELLGGYETCSSFTKTCAVINGVFQNYYEQLPSGVSKATALENLCEVLNIPKGKLFAIGDYNNDIEMLEKADISAAPIESPDIVKQVADYITVGCKDGAVADFIDYLTSKFSAGDCI